MKKDRGPYIALALGFLGGIGIIVVSYLLSEGIIPQEVIYRPIEIFQSWPTPVRIGVFAFSSLSPYVFGWLMWRRKKTKK
ncbi:MAG: hypothetical protein IT567_05740 [Alphaproteobacteria bacterium]|nr:hypothetical protein [Alphaproteobacteria bacterium]